MTSPAKVQSKTVAHGIPLNDILTAVGEKKRWPIFQELVKGKPLPVSEIARRTGITPASTSKHMLFLHSVGSVELGFGGLYELKPGWAVEGENTIEFGPVLLRLDQAG